MTSSVFLADASGIVNSVTHPFLQSGFDIQHFISQLIVFTVIALILTKYAFGPISAILKLRRDKIEQSLRDADQIKQKLAQAESTRREILKKSNEQAAEIIAQANKTAQRQVEAIKAQAASKAELLLKEAREEARRERDLLLQELKSEIGTLVITTTEKVCGKVLTASDQARLGQETTRNIAASQN